MLVKSKGKHGYVISLGVIPLELLQGPSKCPVLVVKGLGRMFKQPLGKSIGAKPKSMLPSCLI
jgi:hypothetical protein